MPKIMLNSVEYTGGGGDSGMELTYDEYLALPEEEKTNGTTYYVKDINGAGKDQFQPVIYSEEEREIGVWCDGKPLYQKTWIIPKASLSSGETTYTHNNNLSIDTLVNVCGATTNGRPLVEYHTNGSWACSIYNIGNNSFWIYLGGSVYSGMSDASTVKVTLQYTKTTDQPGSGTWTPQGVPTVHYDGDEKIVGTWFGETLYEKTFYIESMYISTSDWINTSITIPNCNGLIDQKAWCHDSDYRYIGGAYFYFSVLNGNLYLYAPRLYPSTVYDVYITLQYTKTT